MTKKLETLALAIAVTLDQVEKENWLQTSESFREGYLTLAWNLLKFLEREKNPLYLVPQIASQEMMKGGVDAARKAPPPSEFPPPGHVQIRAAWEAMLEISKADEDTATLNSDW